MAGKIGSLEELKALREKARSEIDLRTGPKGIQINVHMGTCGIAAGAREVLGALAAEISAAGIQDVTLRQSGCAGLCSQEPMLTLTDKSGVGFRYGRLDKRRIQEIVREHVVGGQPVGEYLVTV